jgi:asparagine synthase (glutamine-hydrolysing)
MIVMLDGQGADEYLCGYGEFYITRIKELLKNFQWLNAFKLIKTKAAHKNTSWIKELQSYIKSAYIFKWQKTIKNIIGRSEYSWLSEKWKALAKNSLVDFPANTIRDMSIIEVAQSSIPYQLHSEDRNSMLFSIESRLPFLDHRLVEYVIGLPSSYKINGGYTKFVLREAIKELPEKIRYRKDKMGFVAPDAPWMLKNKDKVRKELEQVIAETGIFSEELLKRFDAFTESKLGYEPIYFRATAFSRFCKLFKMQLN